MGSIPNCAAIGIKTGLIIMIDESISINIPEMSKRTFIIIRNTKGEWIFETIIEVIF